MRLTEQAIIERKEKIIHVAYELFCEYGVDGVTLARIAKDAKVGDSAIYRYFGTKITLLWHTQGILWKEIVEELNTSGQDRVLASESGLEELSILLSRFKTLYKEHKSYILFAKEYNMYLVRNNIKLPKENYEQLIKPVRDKIQGALRRGQADGSIRREESADDQFFIVWGLMRGFVEQMVMYDQIYEGENECSMRFEQVYRYILSAVSNSPKDGEGGDLCEAL